MSERHSIDLVLSPKLLARFWSRVNKDAPFGCWLWTGRVDRKGYGMLGMKRTHRISWFLANGEIADGLQCCHHCSAFGAPADNPLCCNPAHLMLLTAKGHSLDRLDKGQVARGDRHHFRLHPERVACGERQGIAKLTDEKVREIIADRDAGMRNKDIAEREGVSPSVISMIYHRRAWRHVSE